MAKRGRPRAETLNPHAVEDRLKALGMKKTFLCAEVGMTPGQLGDALSDARRKGVAPEKVDKMASVLGCSPETIAPDRLDRFVGIRSGDPTPAGAS